MSQPYPVQEQLISATSERPFRTLVDPRGGTASSPSGLSADNPPVVSLIGNTPMVSLRRVTWEVAPDVSVYVKLEGQNPGGSVKDRAALSIIREAQRTGALAPGKTLLDATSGNTGIAYAMLGAALGFPVHLALPADVSPERVQVLRAFGAALTLTDPSERTDGARRFVRDLAAREPDRYFYADQYDNPANPLAHRSTTGPEIWSQTKGRVTHFVAGLGTGGTMTGVGNYLTDRDPRVRLVGVQPEGPKHGIAGLKHLATSKVPGIYDPSIVDWTVDVSTTEAKSMARDLARHEGLFVGISAGAAVVAALKVARDLKEGVVVALLADGGFKYASAPFWTG